MTHALRPMRDGLAATLALHAREGDKRIRTATLFTTQVDFTFAGDLKVFAD